MTPTSATGNDARGRCGFSLIELMVVVALVGLIATAVAVTLPQPGGGLIEDAERLAARLVAARDEALLTGRAVAVRLDARGYDFLDIRDDAWTPFDTPPLRPAQWREGVAPQLQGETPMTVVFDPTGLADAARITLAEDDRVAVVLITASGEVRLEH